jgi:Trk K+ transport system NAD-binding subunit
MAADAPGPTNHLFARRRPPRRPWRTAGLYALVLLHEFRYTLLTLAAAVALGAVVYRLTPGEGAGPTQLSFGRALYHSWMAMFAQPRDNSPPTLLVGVMCAVYPVLGFVLIGEGVVRLALLMVSRRTGEKEWMRVMASTYRDHVVLCGLGNLGLRVLEQLLAAGVGVVVLEKRRASRHLTHARELGAVILIRDMKEDQALIDAGIAHARAVVICTNDDVANLEVALDSRRLNPKIRVVMRLFDQQIAAKISGALSIDAAFSSSTLAAPVVAALSLQARTLSSYVIGGVPHVAAEVRVEPGSALDGKRVADVELGYRGRVLARTTATGQLESPPTPATLLAAGDTLVVHTQADQVAPLASAAARPHSK